MSEYIKRGHWRTYTHPRYSEERRAQRQWIDAHWVGEREAVHQGVRYKVRLDL